MHQPRLQFEALEARSLLSNFSASWLGQQGEDLVGTGPGVGPDGFVDAEIYLTGLASGKSVSSIRITAQDGTAWEFGSNPQAVNNSEFVATVGDSTSGTLYMSPLADLNLAEESLTINVGYSDNSSDSTTLTAGSVDPTLKDSAALPVSISSDQISAVWKGQDGLNLGGTGAVHLAVSNIPAGRTIVGGMLSDTAGSSWAFGTSGGVALTTVDPLAQPLTFQANGNSTTVDLGFGPSRDETGSSLTLRLIFDDGSFTVNTFQGGAADPGLRMPGIASTTYIAKPGDNLFTIVNDYGTVHLSAGTYTLNATLVLNHPVTIIGDPGSVLLFSQPADSPAWTTAIKVHASNTTLEGFAVRFSGTIEWAPNISYGPAVIGATDNYDVGFTDPLFDLTFKNLDLQSPPASSSWEEAVHLFRLAGAESGFIADNTLKGGTSEFFNGPWIITGNSYVGTMPDTFSYGVFAGHFTHDVQIVDNTIDATSESSKTWRFVVLTQAGINDVVADNTVIGVGPRDTDTVANPNASETILTEAYWLHFEGTPSSISTDGMVIQIPNLQGQFARTGDVVAILAGPDAGQWRMIAQALSTTAFLLDRPLNPQDTLVSIAGGFVNLNVSGNLIDSRGSSTVDDISLAGNLFGTTVADNQILGGKDAIWVDAAPTNYPNIWGWSHASVMDVMIQDNVIEDSIDGVLINVEHGTGVKSNLGRVYLSGTIRGNLVIWSQNFLAQTANPAAFQIDNPLSIDSGELDLTLGANSYLGFRGQTLVPSFKVASATINGTPMVSQVITMTAETETIQSLGLTDGTAAGANPTLSFGGRLSFEPLSTTLSYSYSLSGVDGSFVPIPSDAEISFPPTGLMTGSNTVFVRAMDGFGNIVGNASIAFVYDPNTPAALVGLRLVNDTGSSTSDLVTNDPTLTFLALNSLTYEYSLSGTAGSYLPVSIGPGMTFRPAGLVQGTNTVYLRAADQYGRRSDVVSLTLDFDSVPPSSVLGLQLVVDSGSDSSDRATNDGRLRVSPSLGSLWYEYSLSGSEGTYVPIAFEWNMTFLPSGLNQGSNSVFVRGVDLAGNRTLPAQVSFTYDTLPPAGITSISAKPGGLVTFKPVQDGVAYQYRVGPSASFVNLGTATSFRVVSASRNPKNVYIRAIDQAGNIGPERSIVVRPMSVRAFQSLLRALGLKAKHSPNHAR